MAIQWASWMSRLGWGFWNRDIGIQRVASIAGPTSAGVSVNDQKAMTISAVFRCISLISETSAQLPLDVYTVPKSGRPQLTREHWLNGLLTQPNVINTGDEVREAMVAQVSGWGNGYCHVPRRDFDQRPLALWPLRAPEMEIARKLDRTLAYRYYGDPSGIGVDIDPANIAHFRGFSLDGVVGLSRLAQARQSMGMAVASEGYGAEFFASGGRPTGVLSVDRVLTPAQRAQIRAEFKGLTTSADDRLYVLEAAMKYDAVSVSPEDMQMLQTRNFQVADIARFFGVPLFLLFVQENTPNWGLEQQNLGFLTYALRPYLQRIEKVINQFVLPEKERGGVIVLHDTSELTMPDAKVRAESDAACTNAGILTINEARANRNLDPIPGGEVAHCQVALAPITQLGDSPTRPANPAAPTVAAA